MTKPTTRPRSRSGIGELLGVGDPAKLASGLRMALDRVSIARSQTSERPADVKQ